MVALPQSPWQMLRADPARRGSLKICGRGSFSIGKLARLSRAFVGVRLLSSRPKRAWRRLASVLRQKFCTMQTAARGADFEPGWAVPKIACGVQFQSGERFR